MRLSARSATRHVVTAIVLAASPMTAAVALAENGATPATESIDRSAERHCRDALDAVATLLRRERLAAAERALVTLADECRSMPQVHHNLAAVAARRGQWDDAIESLEAAIALDERTAETVTALRDIHRYRAARAYARTLGVAAPRAPRPVVSAQDSATLNGAERLQAARDARLRDEDALDYDLWHWWTSVDDARRDDHEAHYAEPFVGEPLAALDPAVRPDWDAVSRRIVFTREDAVVVLRWQDGGRLLVLRPGGDRWTIHEESPL